MADYFAHETACIDEGAQIGAGTKIWHFSHVMPKAKIGKNCSLGQNVFVANNVVIGDGCKIQNNVSLYEGVILEDYVFCGPSMVFTNVKTPRCEFPRNTSDDYKKTRIKQGTSIGANATIICGVTINEYAFIAAGAVVTKDIP
ncbi:MAG: N-acetyltransferase, partial [Leptolyngbyaceae cyanobacterium MAG.088]|nr:N-acetyltransferase [Leptolyngbyaceae cyanobacterium MAG.088]